MVTILWSEPEKSVVLTKEDGSTIDISVGTLLTWRRYPMGIKITGFSSKESDTRGPIGLFYLPWRGDHWAEMEWTLKGNPRHLIAFPVGVVHYGQQIEWNDVRLLEGDALLQIKMFNLQIT